MTKTDLAQRVEETDIAQQTAAATGTTIFDLVKRMDGRIRDVLPTTLDVGRFIGLVLTEIRTVPRLAECSQESILAGMMKAAQRGLEIDSTRGQAYLIPRWNKRTRQMEASFQIGYNGFVDIFGTVDIRIDARDVHKNDLFEYAYGLDPFLTHRPARSDRGEITDYYAIIRFPDGGTHFHVMSREECEDWRDRYASTKDKDGKITGPWNDPAHPDQFDAMSRKTTLLQAVKYLALPPVVREAIDVDTVIDIIPDERALPAGTVDVEATETKPSVDELVQQVEASLDKAKAAKEGDDKSAVSPEAGTPATAEGDTTQQPMLDGNDKKGGK